MHTLDLSSLPLLTEEIQSWDGWITYTRTLGHLMDRSNSRMSSSPHHKWDMNCFMCKLTLIMCWFYDNLVSFASLVAQTVKQLPIMRETRVRSLGWEDPLEKEMATHSSIVAWRIPWTEEPGGLQSTGSQRVRHDWGTSLQKKKQNSCRGK